MTLRQIHFALTSLSRNLLNKLLISGYPQINVPDKIKPDLEIAKNTYRNKSQGETFLNLLPNKWDTTAEEVKIIYQSNEDFLLIK